MALSTKEVTPTLGEAIDSDKDGVLDIDEAENTPEVLPAGDSSGVAEPGPASSPTPEASPAPAPPSLGEVGNAGAIPEVSPSPSPII